MISCKHGGGLAYRIDGATQHKLSTVQSSVLVGVQQLFVKWSDGHTLSLWTCLFATSRQSHAPHYQRLNHSS